MMKCINILTKLGEYRSMLARLFEIDPSKIVVTSQYSFIGASINNDEVHIDFEVTEKSAVVSKLYCSEKAREAEVNSKLASVNWPGFDTPSTVELKLADSVAKDIETADSIANIAVNCTAGDNYRPGSFSKVIFANDRVELQQINYMNAKSLDHKNNYSLRSLVFRIALNGKDKMIIEFSDRSSANNRKCGEEVQVAIDWLP